MQGKAACDKVTHPAAQHNISTEVGQTGSPTPQGFESNVRPSGSAGTAAATLSLSAFEASSESLQQYCHGQDTIVQEQSAINTSLEGNQAYRIAII